jgi:hypothetical protein
MNKVFILLITMFISKGIGQLNLNKFHNFYNYDKIYKFFRTFAAQF